MKTALYSLILLVAGVACAPNRPNQPTRGMYDNAEYYEAAGNERPGMSRLGRKRLLPDPHGGLGTTNDMTLKVTDIKLTSQYTILFLTFGEDVSPDTYSRSGSSISFNKDARLVTGNHVDSLKTFRFIKAEGIVLSPEAQPVQVGERVTFRLYFERLDPGIEGFSLFECEDTEANTCWNIRGMHTPNPPTDKTAPNRK